MASQPNPVHQPGTTKGEQLPRTQREPRARPDEFVRWYH